MPEVSISQSNVRSLKYEITPWSLVLHNSDYGIWTLDWGYEVYSSWYSLLFSAHWVPIWSLCVLYRKFNVTSEAEWWGRINWGTKNFEKIRIFGRFSIIFYRKGAKISWLQDFLQILSFLFSNLRKIFHLNKCQNCEKKNCENLCKKLCKQLCKYYEKNWWKILKKLCRKLYRKLCQNYTKIVKILWKKRGKSNFSKLVELNV